MSNEVLFLLSTLVGIFFVTVAARQRSEWLLATIAVNLILVSILGAKLISVFGLVTNAGNIFYACVFLATHFILERQGKKAGFRTIGFGVLIMLSFALLSQLTAHFAGVLASDSANTAVATLFSFSLHITAASIVAYIFAQCVNILIYEWVKRRTKGRSLFLRSNCANIVSQLVDSLLFFSIAFSDLSGPLLIQTILVGWFFKSLVVFLATPFLYMDAYLERHTS